MLERVAGVDVLDRVVGKRQRLVLDVKHEVDRGPAGYVDAEEALSLVVAAAKLNPGRGRRQAHRVQSVGAVAARAKSRRRGDVLDNHKMPRRRTNAPGRTQEASDGRPWPTSRA